MSLRNLRWIIPGLLLVTAAAVFSGAGIERALGRSAGSLSWGPALFRLMLALHGSLLVTLGLTRTAPPQFRIEAGQTSRGAWLLLSGMTALGLGLRFWRLDSCLWLDEILTMVNFARPPLGEILSSFPDQNQHMLYSVLAHGSIRLFGEHAWALRLPSVLFGAGSIWALFLLGRRLIGERQALLACALMTVSYHHIWFSQNARGYMGLLFFTILGTWLWLEALSAGTWRRWVAYAITMFLGLWIHMTMLFVLAAHGLVYLPRAASSWRAGKRPDWKPLGAWLLCGSLTLQAYALSLPEFLRTAVHEVSIPSEWTNPLWVVFESLRSLRVGFAGVAVLLCGAALVATGCLGIFRRQPGAALIMTLPAVLGGASMLLLAHNLWPRFFFFSMGFALLIVVHGAMTLPRALAVTVRMAVSQRLAEGIGLALAGLMIVASALIVPRCYALPKQDFIGAREYVERHREPGQAVIAVGLAGHAYGKYYAPEWSVATSAAELRALESGHSSVALVYTLPIELKAFHPDVWQIVETDFEPVRVFWGTLGGGEVYVCRPRARKQAAAAPRRSEGKQP